MRAFAGAIVVATLLGCTQDFGVFTASGDGGSSDGEGGSGADAACVPPASCTSAAQNCAKSCMSSSCQKNCAQQCVLCAKALCDVSPSCKTASGL